MLQNDSGHTGVNPYLALVVFIPIVGVGALFTAGCRKWQLPIWLGVAAVAIGCLGIAFLVYLDLSNTLLPYEVWIHRGMP